MLVRVQRRAKALESRITSRGRRLTSQRLVVAQALADAGAAISAQELHERLRRRHPRLGLATVYRALEAQVESGMARRLERPGHVYVYVACSPEHHHHLVCTSCQRVRDADESVVASMVRGVRERHGFAVDHARLDLYGLCAACRSAS
ncbi:MAG: transcriptional repressor [Chloroflexi bacterium]|nr:transcriptional repressor [Chloroflexota bacterium]